MQPYIYIIVRKDLKLADQICQVAHACVDAGREFQIPQGCFLVLLQVPNREALMYAAKGIKENHIRHLIAIEPDDDLGETAIATEAVCGEQRKAFSQLKIWRA